MRSPDDTWEEEPISFPRDTIPAPPPDIFELSLEELEWDDEHTFPSITQH